MPVDSVHAPTIIRNARRRPKPYETIQVYYPDILNWKSLLVLRKLQSVDGLDIKMSDVTRVKFKKEHLNKCLVFMDYNCDFLHEVEWTNKRYENVPQAYKRELHINTKKIKNLLDLCKTLTIKKQYYVEYYALRASNNVLDVLTETDVEDNV
ncbi:hypothetical protein ILUMI_15632 [Ignelater luminosus]|uniref:Uncharacterized protein n=1 Tax=Ignelater luminosus TaxID=2038154 RepID=A0A8K0CRV9_IGNLU|nr:hypothetical protein ILUMI_15632 [Ignelater luminosus]